MKDKYKQLKVQIDNLKSEAITVAREQNELNKRAGEIQKRINVLQLQIEEVKEKTAIITDHAVLRMLERMYNIPVEAVRNELITAVKDVLSTGAARIPIGEKLMAVIKNGIVVTVEPK